MLCGSSYMLCIAKDLVGTRLGICGTASRLLLKRGRERIFRTLRMWPPSLHTWKRLRPLHRIDRRTMGRRIHCYQCRENEVGLINASPTEMREKPSALKVPIPYVLDFYHKMGYLRYGFSSDTGRSSAGLIWPLLSSWQFGQPTPRKVHASFLPLLIINHSRTTHFWIHLLDHSARKCLRTWIAFHRG